MTLPAAKRPPMTRGSERLLVIDPRESTWSHHGLSDLSDRLREGDLLVLNDAATLPASLSVTDPTGSELEIRLLRRLGPARWQVALLGPGDWRSPTEERPRPPRLEPGALLTAADDLHLRVEAVHRQTPRLVEVTFVERGEALVQALYRTGRPVQYSYLEADLPIEAFQTAYASRPWAVEMPSAGRGLGWDLLLRLRRRGVGLATLTHAAGLSSLDGGLLDRQLPAPERYALPHHTVTAIRQTRAAGGRIVAVGTTVVRALEDNFRTHGQLTEGEHLATLVLGPGFRPRVTDGVLTNMHERGESHFRLLGSFAAEELLVAAIDDAAGRGYQAHEFGDSCLILGHERGRGAARLG